ncbi:MAG: cell division protein FtsZ [Candidatus Midichloria mitochondrii]|nr:cell division protein FtsZ [Candidatus Midichloria mitochondrii]MDJ1256048.1 cell division protein FtsZ [Candidatus Midichloria mitochondrii]MDJ1287747.1 cell division protein FtsZ [Candidatus Midichloria mitochondrii]MDJ1298611.1 cell division protein FtsZ [Candidatus Midichloria mitochondrii]MDJ1312761.1 cell division protein FtsZ [Candidatus Midichloria mitochondrii]
MSIEVAIPHQETDLKPKIVVFGAGGAGGNAVNNMVTANLEGVDFWAANTDAQALANALASNKIQLGIDSTKGLGAGSHPEVGRNAAEESIDEIRAAVSGCHMLFITAGMGGGTGTGAAPVIARVAKEEGALVVAVVTKPFHFEGARRMKVAELGLEEISKYVDTLIIIPNQNLFHIVNEKTTFIDAFKMADNVLHSGVRSVTDLITMPGLINLDFADIRTVMHEMGKAMMGTGEAEGEDRAIKAAEAAISNPLLDNSSMKGAKGVLINITGGLDMTLFEVDEAANRIKEEVEPGANIIFGSAFSSELQGKLRVSVVATGIGSPTSAVQASANILGIKSKQVLNANEVKTSNNKLNPLQASDIQKSFGFNSEKENSSDKQSSSPNSNIIEEDIVVNFSQSFIPPQAVNPDKGNIAEDEPFPRTNEKLEPGTNISQFEEKKRDFMAPKNSDNLFEIPAFLRKKSNK